MLLAKGLLCAIAVLVSTCSASLPSFSDLKHRVSQGLNAQDNHQHQHFSHAHEVDKLLTQPRSEADTWKAYSLCKSELASRPADAALKIRTAEALLAYLRQKTDGNALRADGSHSDSKANRALWKRHAPEALTLLQETKATKGKDPLHAFLYAEAFMYCSCSTGVVKAALKGDAFHFKKNARPLLEDHPSYGDGVGHTFMGAFYLGAPWPVHSASKARDHFQAARAQVPNCRRNIYYCGLEALWGGRGEEAKVEFERALKAPCGSVEESDIGDFLLRQCREGLQLVQGKGDNKRPAGRGHK